MTPSSLLPIVFNAAWQVTLIVAVAALFGHVARRSPARWRHAFYVMALVASVAAPFLSASHSHTSQRRLDESAVTAAGPSIAPSRLAVGTSWGMAILVAVGLCVAARIVRLLLAARNTRRLAVAETTPVPPEARTVADAAARALEVQHFQLVASGHIAGPVTLGFRRPLIIVPSALNEPAARGLLAAAVGHELAHVRRRDFFWNVVLELLTLPFAFHPGIWFLKRRIDETRELACDELVVTTALVDRQSYAHALVRMAEAALNATSPVYAMGAVAPPLLEERIRTLVEGRAPARTSLLACAAMALVLATLVCTRSGLALTFADVASPGDWLRHGSAACEAADTLGAEEALAHLDEVARAELFTQCASHQIDWCATNGFQLEER